MNILHDTYIKIFNIFHPMTKRHKANKWRKSIWDPHKRHRECGHLLQSQPFCGLSAALGIRQITLLLRRIMIICLVIDSHIKIISDGLAWKIFFYLFRNKIMIGGKWLSEAKDYNKRCKSIYLPTPHQRTTSQENFIFGEIIFI